MKCRICGNDKDNPEYEVKELQLGLGDDFTYFRCSHCGCLQISEIPEDMNRYYSGDYYSYNIKDIYEKNIIKRWLRSKRDRYAFFKQGWLGKFLAKKTFIFPWIQYLDWQPDFRILDIGCGNGIMLNKMRMCGFESLTGIDPFIQADIHYSKGCNIYKQTIEQVQGVFEIIMMHHSLEHMSDHHMVFQNLGRLIAPGGHILIRIPVFCQYFFEQFGKYWLQWDPPRHYYLHSLESFELMCRQYGFCIKKRFWEDTQWTFKASEQYRFKDLGIPPTMTEQEIFEIDLKLRNEQRSDSCGFILEKVL